MWFAVGLVKDIGRIKPLDQGVDIFYYTYHLPKGFSSSEDELEEFLNYSKAISDYEDYSGNEKEESELKTVMPH